MIYTIISQLAISQRFSVLTSPTLRFIDLWYVVPISLDCQDIRSMICNIDDGWLLISLPSPAATGNSDCDLHEPYPCSFSHCFLAFNRYLQYALMFDVEFHFWTSMCRWKSYFEHYPVERVQFFIERFCGLEDGCKFIISFFLFVQLELYFQKVTTLAPLEDNALLERWWEPTYCELLFFGHRVFLNKWKFCENGTLNKKLEISYDNYNIHRYLQWV